MPADEVPYEKIEGLGEKSYPELCQTDLCPRRTSDQTDSEIQGCPGASLRQNCIGAVLISCGITREEQPL